MNESSWARVRTAGELAAWAADQSNLLEYSILRGWDQSVREQDTAENMGLVVKLRT